MNQPLDITFIVLTYNESLHIRRALDNITPIAKKIYIVDSYSTDDTCLIASAYPKVTIVPHEWPGNQSEQFNWALDNLRITTEWVFRLDADEYLLPSLIDSLYRHTPSLPSDVTGLLFARRNIFMGKWIKHGIYPVHILRMFRTGKGRYKVRLMDEHISLSDGQSKLIEGDFCDHSLISLSEYCLKHVHYAQREATEYFRMRHPLTETNPAEQTLFEKKEKYVNNKRSLYNRLPHFWRAWFFFLYRYLLRGAFLHGKEGFIFTFVQCLAYRTLVDAFIFCGEHTALFPSMKSSSLPNNAPTSPTSSNK